METALIHPHIQRRRFGNIDRAYGRDQDDRLCSRGRRRSRRLASAIIHGVLRIGWVLYLMNFGDLTELFAMEDDNGWQRIDIVIHGFMYLMVAERLLKLLIIYGDYRDNRSAYLNGGEEPVRKGKGKRKNEPPSSDSIRVKGRYN